MIFERDFGNSGLLLTAAKNLHNFFMKKLHRFNKPILRERQKFGLLISIVGKIDGY
jgi:hypothetical protein